MRHISIVLIGALFGAGLALSGMLNPSKVAGFLDLFGVWDPSLAFVMGIIYESDQTHSLWPESENCKTYSDQHRKQRKQSTQKSFQHPYLRIGQVFFRCKRFSHCLQCCQSFPNACLFIQRPALHRMELPFIEGADGLFGMNFRTVTH